MVEGCNALKPDKDIYLIASPPDQPVFVTVERFQRQHQAQSRLAQELNAGMIATVVCDKCLTVGIAHLGIFPTAGQINRQPGCPFVNTPYTSQAESNCR